MSLFRYTIVCDAFVTDDKHLLTKDPQVSNSPFKTSYLLLPLVCAICFRHQL